MQIKHSLNASSSRPSSRFALAIGAAFLLFAVLWSIWPAAHSEQPGVPASTRVHRAVSNVVHEAKMRVHGGIGALLSVNRTNGFPLVKGVMSNSPAAAAGLRNGDLITHVNGKPLTAVPLKQTVDTIRGFTGTSLHLTILRPGESNPMSVTIQRASFKSLKISDP